MQEQLINTIHLSFEWAEKPVMACHTQTPFWCDRCEGRVFGGDGREGKMATVEGGKRRAIIGVAGRAGKTFDIAWERQHRDVLSVCGGRQAIV